MKAKMLLGGAVLALCLQPVSAQTVDRMTYEVVQDGAGTAPTPETGFGSSVAATGQPLGNSLVQRYSRRSGEAGSSIIGRWISAGDDVAPLLRGFFNTDSIVAEFRPDGTYLVVDYQNDGEATATFAGSFQSQPSNSEFEGAVINGILINQVQPATATARGIYAINVPTPALPDSMLYEVVQDGAGTAPTPETGFGSTLATTGQALGNLNIQRYKRLTGEPGGSILGRWISKGDDVAPLLVQFFETDSVVAEFDESSYLVVNYREQGASTETFSGSYIATPSDVEERGAPIWAININQVQPATATVRGIFAINPQATTSVEENKVKSPQNRISLAFPNPVKGQHFSIKYKLQREGGVSLVIFNSEGKIIRTALDRTMPAGEHTLIVDTSGLPAGAYYYRLTADGINETAAVSVVK